MFGGPGKSNLASTRFHAFLICAVCSLLTDSAMMLDDDCESGVALYAIPEVENTVLLSPIFWPHTSVIRVSSSLVSRSLRPVEETRGGQQQQQPLITRRANKKSTRKVTSIKAKTDVVLSSNDNNNINYEERKGKAMYDFCVTYPWAILVAGSGVAGFMLKRSVPSLVSGLVLGSLLLLFANKSLQHWQENRPTRKYTFMSLCVNVLLLGIMAPKYILRNGAFFPSGMLTVAGGIIGLYYVFLLLIGGNDALGKKKQ